MESNENEGREGVVSKSGSEEPRPRRQKESLSFCLGLVNRRRDIHTASGVVTPWNGWGYPLSSFWVDAICRGLMALSHTAPRAGRSFSCQWTMNPSARGLSPANTTRLRRRSRWFILRRCRGPRRACWAFFSSALCDIVMHDVATADDTEIPNLNYIDPVVRFYLVTCFLAAAEIGINLCPCAAFNALWFCSPLFPPQTKTIVVTYC